MFCVLNIEKRPNTLREKLFGSFIKDEYEAKMIPVFKAAPFYIIDVKIGKRGVDWDRIVYCAGKCARRLVLTNHIKLPPRNDMSKFKSNMLYREIMCNTFAEILKKFDDKKTVSVIDNKGENANLLYKIAPFSSALTVVTNAKEKYTEICDSIQQNCGLCTVIQTSSAEAQVKIDTERCVMTVIGEKSCTNISDGGDFTVPEIYQKLLPDNADKYTFYAALYELCGVFSLGECVFDTITVNNKKINLTDLDTKEII